MLDTQYRAWALSLLLLLRFGSGFLPGASRPLRVRHTTTAREFSTVSPPPPPPTVPAIEAEVLAQLRNVIDPDLGSDIVSLGFIKNLVVEVRVRVQRRSAAA